MVAENRALKAVEKCRKQGNLRCNQPWPSSVFLIMVAEMFLCHDDVNSIHNLR